MVGLGAKVFVGYSIYKGKAALTVEPRPPEFVPLDVCLIALSLPTCKNLALPVFGLKSLAFFLVLVVNLFF